MPISPYNASLPPYIEVNEMNGSKSNMTRFLISDQDDGFVIQYIHQIVSRIVTMNNVTTKSTGYFWGGEYLKICDDINYITLKASGQTDGIPFCISILYPDEYKDIVYDMSAMDIFMSDGQTPTTLHPICNGNVKTIMGKAVTKLMYQNGDPDAN